MNVAVRVIKIFGILRNRYWLQGMFSLIFKVYYSEILCVGFSNPKNSNLLPNFLYTF